MTGGPNTDYGSAQAAIVAGWPRGVDKAQSAMPRQHQYMYAVCEFDVIADVIFFLPFSLLSSLRIDL